MLHIMILLQLSGYNIEVFYASSQSPRINYIQSEHIQYFDLDAPSSIEAQINLSLKGISEGSAAADFSRFQNSSEGASLIESLTDAYTSISRSVHLGLTHIPAVVFDGHSVVYGTTDVHVAHRELSDER